MHWADIFSLVFFHWRTGKKTQVTNDIINNKRKIDIKYLFIIQIYDCSSIFFIASISFSSWLLHTNTLSLGNVTLFFLSSSSLHHSLSFNILSIYLYRHLVFCCCFVAFTWYYLLSNHNSNHKQHHTVKEGETKREREYSSVFCLLILGWLQTWNMIQINITCDFTKHLIMPTVTLFYLHFFRTSISRRITYRRKKRYEFIFFFKKNNFSFLSLFVVRNMNRITAVDTYYCVPFVYVCFFSCFQYRMLWEQKKNNNKEKLP